MNDELKPCPFCGGDAEIRTLDNGFGHQARCKTTCGVTGKIYRFREDAIKAWNSRPLEAAAKLEVVKRIRSLIEEQEEEWFLDDNPANVVADIGKELDSIEQEVNE